MNSLPTGHLMTNSCTNSLCIHHTEGLGFRRVTPLVRVPLIAVIVYQAFDCILTANLESAKMRFTVEPAEDFFQV